MSAPYRKPRRRAMAVCVAPSRARGLGRKWLTSPKADGVWVHCPLFPYSDPPSSHSDKVSHEQRQRDDLGIIPLESGDTPIDLDYRASSDGEKRGVGLIQL